MASLMLHCGSGAADKKRLYGVKTPPSTETYMAVPFGTIRDMLVAAASARSLHVCDERWGLSRGDQRAFGVITFYDDEAPDSLAADTTLGMAVGVRASHDRSLPIGFCAGGHLFVCDIGTTVKDEAGLSALGIMYGHGVITNRQFTVAVDHWLEPPAAFMARNAWSLYNSVTEGLKHGEAGTLLSRHIDAEGWLWKRFEFA